jgi:carbonic anhydrase/acetyltransferase-like protein (isoleucine patch superfamily)
MILEHQGKRPSIDPTARVAPTAVICGAVTIGANSSIGFGAVVVAESGAVSIGRDCVVMDTAVIRGVRGNPVTIGDHVLVGPRAYLSGCSVADDAFLATGATVFNGARIGRRAEVRINGLVHLRSVLPDDATVPINWVAVGDPAQILPPDRHDEIWAAQKPLDFPRYVFGVERPRDGQSIMPEVMPRYAAFLARAHGTDRQVEP